MVRPTNAIGKAALVLLAAVVAIALPAAAAAAAKGEEQPSSSPPLLLGPRRALLQAPNGTTATNRLSAPTVDCVSATETSIRVRVCPGDSSGGAPPGASSAPYGLKLQFEDLAAFVADGGWCGCPGAPSPPGADVCSLRTNDAFASPHDCWSIEVGGPVAPGVSYLPPDCAASLLCGEQYVFRAFALGGAAFNGSVASETALCATQACPSVSCEDDADCPEDETCEDGRCVALLPECVLDADCPGPGDPVCASGRCVQPGCARADDCDAPGDVCRQGQCVPRE
jgi:hypothetical protein